MRVLLADDHQLLRQAIRRALEDAGLTVIAEAGDGGEAVRLAGELQPDVVVMDVSMPVLDGVEATRRLHAEFPDLPIVILTMHGDEALRRDAVARRRHRLPHQGRLDAGGRGDRHPGGRAATSPSRPSWRPRSWPSWRTAPTSPRRP